MGNGGWSWCDGHTLPQGEEGAHLEMAAVKMAVCYVSPRPPVADGLLIKQKLDTETNYRLALLCGLIQGLVSSMWPVKAKDC